MSFDPQKACPNCHRCLRLKIYESGTMAEMICGNCNTLTIKKVDDERQQDIAATIARPAPICITPLDVKRLQVQVHKCTPMDASQSPKPPETLELRCEASPHCRRPVVEHQHLDSQLPIQEHPIQHCQNVTQHESAISEQRNGGGNWLRGNEGEFMQENGQDRVAREAHLLKANSGSSIMSSDFFNKGVSPPNPKQLSNISLNRFQSHFRLGVELDMRNLYESSNPTVGLGLADSKILQNIPHEFGHEKNPEKNLEVIIPARNWPTLEAHGANNQQLLKFENPADNRVHSDDQLGQGETLSASPSSFVIRTEYGTPLSINTTDEASAKVSYGAVDSNTPFEPVHPVDSTSLKVLSKPDMAKEKPSDIQTLFFNKELAVASENSVAHRAVQEINEHSKESEVYVNDTENFTTEGYLHQEDLETRRVDSVPSMVEPVGVSDRPTRDADTGGSEDRMTAKPNNLPFQSEPDNSIRDLNEKSGTSFKRSKSVSKDTEVHSSNRESRISDNMSANTIHEEAEIDITEARLYNALNEIIFKDRNKSSFSAADNSSNTDLQDLAQGEVDTMNLSSISSPIVLSPDWSVNYIPRYVPGETKQEVPQGYQRLSLELFPFGTGGSSGNDVPNYIPSTFLEEEANSDEEDLQSLSVSESVDNPAQEGVLESAQFHDHRRRSKKLSIKYNDPTVHMSYSITREASARAPYFETRPPATSAANKSVKTLQPSGSHAATKPQSPKSNQPTKREPSKSKPPAKPKPTKHNPPPPVKPTSTKSNTQGAHRAGTKGKSVSVTPKNFEKKSRSKDIPPKATSDKPQPVRPRKRNSLPIIPWDNDFTGEKCVRQFRTLRRDPDEDYCNCAPDDAACMVSEYRDAYRDPSCPQRSRMRFYRNHPMCDKYAPLLNRPPWNRYFKGCQCSYQDGIEAGEAKLRSLEALQRLSQYKFGFAKTFVCGLAGTRGSKGFGDGEPDKKMTSLQQSYRGMYKTDFEKANNSNAPKETKNQPVNTNATKKEIKNNKIGT